MASGVMVNVMGLTALSPLVGLMVDAPLLAVRRRVWDAGESYHLLHAPRR